MSTMECNLVSWSGLVTKATFFFTHNVNTTALYIKRHKSSHCLCTSNKKLHFSFCKSVYMFEVDIEHVNLCLKIPTCLLQSWLKKFSSSEILCG